MWDLGGYIRQEGGGRAVVEGRCPRVEQELKPGREQREENELEEGGKTKRKWTMKGPGQVANDKEGEQKVQGRDKGREDPGEEEAWASPEAGKWDRKREDQGSMSGGMEQATEAVRLGMPSSSRTIRGMQKIRELGRTASGHRSQG